MGDSFSVPLLLHVLLCSSAIAVCTYALYVDSAKGKDDGFEAFCDIDEHMSCSAVLTSKYSKGFGVVGELLGEDHVLNMANGIYGIAFYICIALLGFWGSRLSLRLMIVGELLGAMNFVYLAYAMRYILNDICVVCFTLYAIHALLLALHTYQYCGSLKTVKKKKTT